MIQSRATFSIVGIALLSSACTSPIHIIKPDAKNPYDPVTQAVVTFDTKFNPAEPWHVDLDGTDLTGFSPAPAPGGSSTVPLSFAKGGGHTIKAAATCGTFCAYNAEEVKFTVPQLVYNSTTYASTARDLKQFSAASVYVGVQNFRSVPITVTIMETSTPSRVKLAVPGGPFQPPGSAITVTIPATTTKADFQVQGDVLGTYILGFSAPGVAAGTGSGKVQP